MRIKQYWLKGVILGATINVLYALVTLLMFPIGNCHTNTMCGFMWEMVNFHNLIIPIPFLKYNMPWSTLIASIIVGSVLGLVIGFIYGKVKNK